MFGQNYKYQKASEPLPEGSITVFLTSIAEKRMGEYNALEFCFAVPSIQGEFYPNRFILFDAPDSADKKAVASFCSKASKIKRCFLLEGSFCISSYNSWRGASGRIMIGKDKNGYLTVLDFLEHEQAGEYEAKGLL